MVEISDKEYQRLQLQLKEIQELGRIGSWEYEVASQKLTWSDEVFVLYERDFSLGSPTIEEEAGYYSPAQTKILHEYAARAIEAGEEFKYDLQANLPGGKTAYFYATMRPVKDKNGRVIKLFGTVQDITERKRAEEEVKRSEGFFKGVTENASDVIVIVDRKGTIKYVSLSAERSLGYKQEEVIGRKVFDFIQPVDLPRAMIDFAKAVTTKEVAIPNSFRVRHKDGSVRIFEGLGKNLFDDPAVAGFVMNVRDITEQRRFENDIKGSEARYKTLFDSSIDVLVQIDTTGTIIDLNKYAEAVSGYKKEEIVGKKISALAGKFTAQSLALMVANFAKRKLGIQVGAYEVESIGSAGQRLFFEINAVPLKADAGKEIGELAIMHDITERKRAADEMAIRSKSLRK